MKFQKIGLMRTAIITAAVVSGLVVGGLGVSKSEAALDWLGLEQKLTNHDERLDSQDDRITNTEKDVEELQENTNTQPSTERVVVREVVTPAPAPVETPAPAPVTVVAFEKVPIEGTENIDCKLTYSDGTTYQWHWKVYTSSTAWTTSNTCDQYLVGTIKP